MELLERGDPQFLVQRAHALRPEMRQVKKLAEVLRHFFVQPLQHGA
jgi:hypothetical protein